MGELEFTVHLQSQIILFISSLSLWVAIIYGHLSISDQHAHLTNYHKAENFSMLQILMVLEDCLYAAEILSANVKVKICGLHSVTI